MLSIPLLFVWLFAWIVPAEKPAPVVSVVVEAPRVDAAATLYAEIGLADALPEQVFTASYRRAAQLGADQGMLAIADMSQPSTAKRFYIIDLAKKELVLRTWVAHGQGSGELHCTSFSNREGSHATSKGLYRVGAEIVSPKHGAALLLHGLDKGLNCQAQSREVIMHGADYVSADFIAQHGRLGRSWGCPAVSRAEMPRMIDLLADGGLLFVYGKR